VKTWRKVHRLTIVAWAFAAVHAIGAGSDASAPWFQAILVTAAVPILFLFTYRVMPVARRAPRREAGAA
jgi:DMSO/TMAO reductase YedYZ heme-binding membrane subunit